MSMSLPLPLILDTLARMALIVTLLLIVWPRYALPPIPGVPLPDRLVIQASQMTLRVIIIGYVLTAAHLYEWATVAVCLVLLARLERPPRTLGRYELQPGTRRLARAFLALDHLKDLPKQLYFQAISFLKQTVNSWSRPSLFSVAALVICLIVLAVSAWMRFWSNFDHAAFPYSDAYVVLDWVKLIMEQHLFPNGIYPEGFHVFLATLAKMSLANTLVFVKFFGPAVGLGMVASVGYSAYRLTGKIGPAICGMLLYGTLTALLPYEAPRQSATDSQEFGNMMVLPLAYLSYQAWADGRKAYRIGALSLLAVVALVHELALLNAVLACVSGTAAAWLVCGVRREIWGWIFGRVGLAALAAITPIAIGLALHIPLYASSAKFLTAKSLVAAPPLSPMAVLAIVCCVGLLLWRLLRFGLRTRDHLGAPLIGLLLVVLALLIQQSPRLGLHSLVLTGRAGEFLALTEGLAIALGYALVEEIFGAVGGARLAQWLGLVLLVAGGAFLWHRLPPAPLRIYRMNSDEFVAEFVRLEQQFTPTGWLAVSGATGYDLALGEGYQLYTPDFLANVSPNKRWPVYHPKDHPPVKLGEDHIFFFVRRHFFVPYFVGPSPIPYRRVVNARLIRWIHTWESHFGPMHVYYRGYYLTIYEISRRHSSALKQLFGGTP